ncbi:hypothetical protein HPB50_003328 [Hyalomma asiaticum]|uniref:Uncharacterized protein n=1 Tax=Hyalomma asiaticum TaxID=266040 RepID=A0ACB7S404_HYAAI|nr:hypothetical protein HPB50_003328 [Hyalomma asiaticum]
MVRSRALQSGQVAAAKQGRQPGATNQTPKNVVAGRSSLAGKQTPPPPTTSQTPQKTSTRTPDQGAPKLQTAEFPPLSVASGIRPPAKKKSSRIDEKRTLVELEKVMGLSGEALLAWVSAEKKEMRDQRAKEQEEARLAAQAEHERAMARLEAERPSSRSDVELQRRSVRA